MPPIATTTVHQTEWPSGCGKLKSLMLPLQPKFLDVLANRVLVFDGAMGVSIQAYNLTPEDFDGKEGCNDILSVTRSDVIEEIHASFCAVGVDVLETNTFGASRFKLAEYGIEDRHDEINAAAVAIARDRKSTRLNSSHLGI